MFISDSIKYVKSLDYVEFALLVRKNVSFNGSCRNIELLLKDAYTIIRRDDMLWYIQKNGFTRLGKKSSISTLAVG